MKKCLSCGSNIEDQLEVCPICGNQVNFEGQQEVDCETTRIDFDQKTVPVMQQEQSENNKNRRKSWVKWLIIGAVAVLAIVSAVLFFVLGNFMTNQTLKMVPSKSDFVVTINGMQMLDASGIELSGSGVELPRSVESFINIMDADTRKKIKRLLKSKCFNPVGMTFVANVAKSKYGLDNLESYLIVNLLDKEEAIDLLKDFYPNLKFEEKNGYKIAKDGYDNFIIIGDEYCWIYEGSRHVVEKSIEEYDGMTVVDMARRLDKIKKEARDKSIADVSYKNEVLDGESVVAAFYDSENMSRLLGKKWSDYIGETRYDGGKVGVEIKFVGMAVEARAKLYDKNGNQIDLLPYSGKINSSMAKYLTDTDIMVSAMAIDPNTPWSEIVSKIEKNVGEEIPSEVRTEVMDFLQSTNGTFMFAGGVDWGKIINVMNGDYSCYSFVSMLEMKKGKAKELLDKVAGRVTNVDSCLNVKYDNSILEVDVKGMKFNVQVKDENLCITNRPIVEAGNEDMPSTFFDGKMIASMSRIKKSTPWINVIGIPGDMVWTATSDNKDFVVRYEIEGLSESDGYASVIDFWVSKYATIVGMFRNN